MNLHNLKVTLLAVCTAVSVTVFGKNEIQFLDYYDQLDAYKSQPGHWFVRDAAANPAGQHGDPTIAYGWGMYTWDFSFSKWIKICDQQSMNQSVPEELLSNFVKLSTYTNDINKIYSTFVKKSDYDVKIEYLEQRSDMAINKANRLKKDLIAATNETLNAAKKYTDEHSGGVDTNAVKEIAGELDTVVLTNAMQYTDSRIGTFDNSGRMVTIGSGAINSNNRASIVINNCSNYTSSVGGDFNINIGIDNTVGDYTNGNYNARYAVAIGTSARASKMHSYAWGSQINAFAANSTVIGYGLSATDELSVVIGHGNRSICDRRFTNETAMVEFLSNAACTNEIFVGYGILCDNGPGCSHIIDAVLTTPDPETGMYATVRSGPYDIEVGKRKWSYGKSHGRGTFNIVAIGDGTTDPGPANVYINDKPLTDWFGINIGQATDKLVYNKGIFGPEIAHCEHDYTVAIGENAKAVETATSCQAIAIGRDALSAGSATVAVGPNSFAYGSLAAALGWRANAIGARSIAIGAAKKSGQNYFVDGVVNTNSDLCAAVGDDSIAIGFNSKANSNKSAAVGYYATASAIGAVQLGMGTNTTPNSLKFMDVDVVKDGKVCGTFNPSVLDPQKIDVSPVETLEELTITAMPHVVNTIVTTKPTNPGTEVYVEPSGSRNYEIFIPNTAEFRAGLPINIESEVAGAESLFTDDKKQCYKLPVMIKIQQPIESDVLCTVKELKDKTDWKPVITNTYLVCTNTSTTGSVAPKFETIGEHALEGLNLHAATSFQIVYPIDSSLTTCVTNDLETASAGSVISGTFYYYTSKISYTPSPAMGFKSVDTKLNSWYKIIYKTVNGEAEVKHFDVSFEIDL